MLSRNTMLQPELISYLQQLPYDVCCDSLYSASALFDRYDPENAESLKDCFDSKVYQYYAKHLADPLNHQERWAQYCHDYSISNALNRMLNEYKPRKVVGIMGGHELKRSDPFYRKIVFISKKITEIGWLVTTGGGPGAMEAGHLGAWLAGRSLEEVEEALGILSVSDCYSDEKWLTSEYEVYLRFPQKSGFRSLAIPTWLFGREPPIFFATDTAKFFANSIRESTLLSISFGGILFLPGSAGTFREIFQKIVQNHYLVWHYPSPMIFVGKEYWTHKVPIYPVVREMLKSRMFKNLLSALVDDIDDVVDIVRDFENLYPIIRAKQRNDTHAILEILSQDAQGKE